MKITSSGIIRNEEKPRVGVLSANGSKVAEWIWDEIDQGIDLTWEEFNTELESREQEIEAGPSLSEQEKDAKLLEIEQERDTAEFDSRTVLFGDAWVKNSEGKYEIDQRKEFAAVYSSDSNVITVEWSRYTVPCHHTSPCYVMADGSGPCGDLDTPGDSVIAFTLPPELLTKEDPDNDKR